MRRAGSGGRPTSDTKVAIAWLLGLSVGAIAISAAFWVVVAPRMKDASTTAAIALDAATMLLAVVTAGMGILAQLDGQRMREYEAHVALAPRISWQRRGPQSAFQRGSAGGDEEAFPARDVVVQVDLRPHGGMQAPLLSGDAGTRFDLSLLNYGRGPANILRATRVSPEGRVGQVPQSTVLGAGAALDIAVVVVGLDAVYQKPWLIEFGYEDAFGKEHAVGLELQCARVQERDGSLSEVWTLLRYVPR